MTIIERFKSWIRPQGATTSTPGNWLVDWFRGGQSTESGVQINVDNALKMSAVWACVRLKADSLSTLPCKLYQQSDDGKVELKNNQLYRLLHQKPNRWQNAREFKFFMQAALELWGNAYAVKVIENGQVTSLLPVTPNDVTVEVFRDRVVYHITQEDGEAIVLEAPEVLHLRQMNLADDGITGLSTIGYQREVLGGSIARRDYGNRFFGNGSIPGGILEFPGRMTPEQKQEMRYGWQQLHSKDNQHKVAILDQGLKYQQISVPNEDSQWIESMSFDIADVARIFGVPSPLINDHSRSSFNNVEQLSLNWRVYGIRPMTALWASALNDQCLMTPQQRNSMFFDFVIEDLLSADLGAKSDYLEKMHFNGFMTRNEVRSKLNLNPVEGGDTFYMQTAMAPLDDNGRLVAIDSSDQPTVEQANNDAIAHLVDQASRLSQIEMERIIRAAGRESNFLQWLDDFADAHHKHCIEKLELPAKLAGITDIVELGAAVTLWIADGHSEVVEASGSATSETLKPIITQTLNEWPAARSAALLEKLGIYNGDQL